LLPSSGPMLMMSTRTDDMAPRYEGVMKRQRAVQLQGSILPLPGTPGRGQGRGVRGVRRRIAQLTGLRFSPLSPALSPVYRGEGVRSLCVPALITSLLVLLVIG